ALTLNMQGDIFGTGRLDCTFDGGQGRDALAVNSAVGTALGGPGVEVGIGSQMSVNLFGGGGRGNPAVKHPGGPGRARELPGDGSRDRDSVSGIFNLAFGSGFLINPGDPMFPAGVPLTTPAKLDAQVLGGRDRDNLTLVVVKIGSGNLTINALIDGGPQRDTCS